VHLHCGQTNHQHSGSQNERQHVWKTMRDIRSDFTARFS